MRNLRSALIVVLTVLGGLLGLYEITAKSPALLGQPLPGWRKCCLAERRTPWRQPTGIPPLDSLLHESREALLFYGPAPRPGHQFRRPGPNRSSLSSRSPSKPR